MQTRQLAVSDVILGRLSYVPIVTIAVPIFDAAGAVAGVAGGSLDLSKFEHFVEDFRSLPNARITVLDQHARVIFTSGKTSFTALQSLAQDDLVRGERQARQRRLPLRAGRDRRRQRVRRGSPPSAVDGADRLEGVRRAAARQHPAAVDRLLRASRWD